MSGFAQLASFAEAEDWYRNWFAGRTPALEPFPFWTHGDRDWTANAAAKETIPNAGFTWLQGAAPTRGRLWGGCFEVLEMLKGNSFLAPARVLERTSSVSGDVRGEASAPAGDVLAEELRRPGSFRPPVRSLDRPTQGLYPGGGRRVATRGERSRGGGMGSHRASHRHGPRLRPHRPPVGVAARCRSAHRSRGQNARVFGVSFA